jgi:hypothetical protein
MLTTYSNKLKNIEEMDKFLDVLNQDQINHLSEFIWSNEIKVVRKSNPTKKSPALGGFSTEFTGKTCHFHELEELINLMKMVIWPKAI